jgi:hypothetical protein
MVPSWLDLSVSWRGYLGHLPHRTSSFAYSLIVWYTPAPHHARCDRCIHRLLPYRVGDSEVTENEASAVIDASVRSCSIQHLVSWTRKLKSATFPL